MAILVSKNDCAQCRYLVIHKTGKGKEGKVLPRTGHKGLEGEHRFSSALSLTSALDEGG
jgi:hypothetical protein